MFIKILSITAAVFLLLCGCAATEPVILKESHKFGTGNVFPVLYYEDHDISLMDTLDSGAETHTFRIESGEAFELEKHYRTWGKTYPSSAMEKLSEMGLERKDYGQLMIYYGTQSETVFLFDEVLSENNYEYTLIVNGRELKIPYDTSEYFVNLLRFDGYYYLLALGNNEEFIRIHRISDSLEEREVFDIDYSSAGISAVNIMYDAAAAAKDVIAIPTGGIDDYNLIIYNFKTGETEFLSSEYGIWGLVADRGYFHVIGFTENYEVVFDTIGTNGKSTNKTVVDLPVVIEATKENFSHKEVFYMYGTEIYCNFSIDGKCCLASFDIESKDWTNIWMTEKHEEYRGPGNIKFVVKEGNEYYDIFPNTSNVEFSEPPVIAEHIAALNEVFQETFFTGFDYSGETYARLFENEQINGTTADAIPDLMVKYSEKNDKIYEDYYADAGDADCYLIDNYCSKAEIYDVLGEWLAEDIFIQDIEDNMIEYGGRLYMVRGGRGYSVKSCSGFRIEKQTETEIIAAGNYYLHGDLYGTINLDFSVDGSKILLESFSVDLAEWYGK